MKMRFFYFLLFHVLGFSLLIGQIAPGEIVHKHGAVGGLCKDCDFDDTCFEVDNQGYITIPYYLQLMCNEEIGYPDIEFRYFDCYQGGNALDDYLGSFNIDLESGVCETDTAGCEFVKFSGNARIYIGPSNLYCDQYGESVLSSITICGALIIDDNYLDRYSSINTLYDLDCFDYEYDDDIDYTFYGDLDYKLGNPSLIPPVTLPICCEGELDTPPADVTGRKRDTSVDNSVIIFPNPTFGNLSITSLKESSEVNIYSSMGRKVFTEITESDHLNILTQNWPSGVYFVLIKKNGAILETDKIIKE